MRIRALSISAFALLASAGTAFAQTSDPSIVAGTAQFEENDETAVPSGIQPVISVELENGYLIQAPNYLVTEEPVVHTDIFVPLDNGLFLDVLFTTELSNAHPFDKPGDEIDVTFGGNTTRGAYTLSARTSWYATPESGNDIVLVEAGVSRTFGDWKASTSVEFQDFGGGIDQSAILHLGATGSVNAFGQDVEIDVGVHQYDDGFRTYTGTLTTTVEVAGVALRPRIRFSTANEGDSHLTFGIGHTF